MGVVTAVQIEGADYVSFRIPGIFASIPKEVAIRIADVTPMLIGSPNSTGSSAIGELVFLQVDDRPVVLNARYDANKEASTITDAVRDCLELWVRAQLKGPCRIVTFMLSFFVSLRA